MLLRFLCTWFIINISDKVVYTCLSVMSFIPLDDCGLWTVFDKSAPKLNMPYKY
jgi:hypothetical protein